MSSLFYKNVTFVSRTSSISILPGDILPAMCSFDEMIADKFITEFIELYESIAYNKLIKMNQMCPQGIDVSSKDMKLMYLGTCTRKLNYSKVTNPKFHRTYYKVMLIPHTQIFWIGGSTFEVIALESKLGDIFNG